jgi:glycosyltransferase involved in cell wall biosynthesis
MTDISMKKICLVIHSLGIGGMERVMSELANSFAGYEKTEVHIILIGLKRDVAYALDDRVIVRKPPFTFRHKRRTIDTIRTMTFLRKVVNEIQPDTILSFGEMWNNLVLLSLMGTGYPVYISDRSQPDKNLGILHNRLRNLLYPKAAGFIAQTGYAAENCLKNGWNKNVKVIGNPVRQVTRDDTVEKENIVLFVGRLIPTKHVDDLIRMFAEIDDPDWKLVIVGGDAKKMKLSEELNQLVKELNVENRVLLEGEQKDVDSYYNRSKIFAFPSSSEGFPNVIGEAMSAGLPVIAYDCKAGPSDLIINEETGFLVDLFDRETFKKRLLLLMNDESLRYTFSIEAVSIMKNFSSAEIAEYFYKFVSDIT